MSPSKSKCQYSNTCLHFLRRTVPFDKLGLIKTSNINAWFQIWTYLQFKINCSPLLISSWNPPQLIWLVLMSMYWPVDPLVLRPALFSWINKLLVSYLSKEAQWRKIAQSGHHSKYWSLLVTALLTEIR